MSLCEDFVLEACSASGTADYNLTGPPANTPYVSFVAAFGTGARVFYVVQSDTTYKWEIGWGIVTDGSPDTLTRNVLRSWDTVTLSTSAKVNWGGSDGSLRCYCAAIAPAVIGALTFHRGTTAPAYPIPGMVWQDITTLTAVVWKHYDGTDWITLPWALNETTNKVVINENKGTDIASASSIDLGAADGNFVDITGTTTITALGTAAAGIRRTVRFTGALTLTHNGTSLILPGGVNITTVAGDTAELWSLGSGNWVCTRYTRASVGIDILPVGACINWPTDTVPANYLERDGSLISRTTYAALFAVLVTVPGFTGQTFTVTIASPGVVTKNTHGFTGGERLRLSTTGALPTGLDTTSDFFVIYVDANTFRLASSEANAAAGTAINTSGGQSGTHTYTRSLFGLGDGSTTFKLPDDRGLFMRGKPSSGRAVATYQADDNKSHSHNVTYLLGGLAGGAGGNGVFQGATPGSVDASGGTEARPINRVYLPIIKYA